MPVELVACGWTAPVAGGGGGWELGGSELPAAVCRQVAAEAGAGADHAPERASLGSGAGAVGRGTGGPWLAEVGSLGCCSGVGWLCRACAAARPAPTSYRSIGEPGKFLVR